MNTTTLSIGERTVVTDDLIQRCLRLYNPQFVHLRRAAYNDGSLSAVFDAYPLELHRKPLSHLSRVQVVHFLGQAAFVLGGCLASDGLLSPLTLEEYFAQVDAEACTFRQLKLQFRRYLPNADGTTITMCCGRKYRSRNGWLMDLRFELNDGACYGSAHGVVGTPRTISGEVGSIAIACY